MSYVIDASGFLCLLRMEPGHEAVVQCIEAGAKASTVNLSEVMAVLVRAGMPAEAAASLVQDLPVEVVDFDLDLALRAGAMIPLALPAGLSMGDRACLALSAREGDVAVTADRSWADIAQAVGVEVMLVR